MTNQRSIVRATADTSWGPSSNGVASKPVAGPGGMEPATRTSIVRLEPGAKLPDASAGLGRELLVLEGGMTLGEASVGRGDYLRLPERSGGEAGEATGCTLFIKEGPFDPADRTVVHVRADSEPWRPGQGNLRVKPLHSHGTTGTALVHWPPGERFLPHTHFGGEEIFVISGVFRDEHGDYPAGTWIQSPHMSSHHPFVKGEETVIFVKTGHLGSGAPAAPGL